MENLKSIQENYKKIISEPSSLKEEDIPKYIRTIQALHKLGPNLPHEIATNRGVPESFQIYQEVEKIVLENGFQSYIEFIKINSKIAWAWSLFQAEKGIQDFDELTNQQLKELDMALSTPGLPNQTRNELEKARAQILENLPKNKNYAKLTLKIMQPFTNEKDMQLIQKYQTELMEAFTGVTLEK